MEFNKFLTLRRLRKCLVLKAQAQGFLSSVFDANLIAPLIKELAKKAIPLEKDPKLKNLQQDLSLQMADRTFLSLVQMYPWLHSSYFSFKERCLYESYCAL